MKPQDNHSGREKRMYARKPVQPRYKIVSMRLREDEWNVLHEECSKTTKNMSDFMRDIILAKAKRKQAASKRLAADQTVALAELTAAEDSFYARL